RTPVAIERLVREVCLQVSDRGRELVDRLGLAAEVEQRGVAASDAEYEPAARRLLQGGRDVGERGGMPRERVRHTGCEPETFGRVRRERDRDERVADEVLRVGEGDAVPADRL